MQSVPCAIARNARTYLQPSDKPGLKQQGSILLKQTEVCVETMLKDQPCRMNTLRRKPMSFQESLPAPLDSESAQGKSARLNLNRLRNADS